MILGFDVPSSVPIDSDGGLGLRERVDVVLREFALEIDAYTFAKIGLKGYFDAVFRCGVLRFDRDDGVKLTTFDESRYKAIPENLREISSTFDSRNVLEQGCIFCHNDLVDDLDLHEEIDIALLKFARVDIGATCAEAEGSGLDRKGGRDVHSISDLTDLVDESSSIGNDLTDLTRVFGKMIPGWVGLVDDHSIVDTYFMCVGVEAVKEVSLYAS